MSNKLRTFKLIDREGYLSSSEDCAELIITYLTDSNCFEGHLHPAGELLCKTNKNITLIHYDEFQFFEEVFPENEDSLEETTPRNLPLQIKSCPHRKRSQMVSLIR